MVVFPTWILTELNSFWSLVAHSLVQSEFNSDRGVAPCKVMSVLQHNNTKTRCLTNATLSDTKLCLEKLLQSRRRSPYANERRRIVQSCCFASSPSNKASWDLFKHLFACGVGASFAFAFRREMDLSMTNLPKSSHVQWMSANNDMQEVAQMSPTVVPTKSISSSGKCADLISRHLVFRCKEQNSANRRTNNSKRSILSLFVGCPVNTIWSANMALDVSSLCNNPKFVALFHTSVHFKRHSWRDMKSLTNRSKNPTAFLESATLIKLRLSTNCWRHCISSFL